MPEPLPDIDLELLVADKQRFLRRFVLALALERPRSCRPPPPLASAPRPSVEPSVEPGGAPDAEQSPEGR